MWPLWIVVLLAIGALIIVIENAMIIIIVLTNKSLRTYTNGLIVSLAFSDVLVGGVFMPAYLANPGLGANGYLVAILLYTNVSNICAVTTERYLAVLKPMLYETTMKKYFLYIVLACWVIPVSVSLLPLAWEEDSDSLVHKLYVGFLLIFCTLIPCIYVVCVYVVVFREVRRQLVFLARQEEENSDSKPGLKRITKESRVAIMFAFIAGVFVASWAPTIYMTSVHTLAGRTDLVPQSLIVISVFLVELSAATNAVVYCMYKRDFRAVLKRCLGRGEEGMSDNEETEGAITMA